MKRLLIAFAAIAATAVAVAPSALAKHGADDPAGHQRHARPHHVTKVERWEHRFHFTLTKANAMADADHDGVPNASECHNGTDPRHQDTNHNGRPDGAEDHDHDGIPDNRDTAATVKSFTAATATAPAVLVIALPDGTTETGNVTAATEIRCETAAVVPTTTTRRHGGDDDGADDNGHDGDNRGPGNDNGDRDDNDANCTVAALTAATVVHSAEVRITSAGRVFEEIELIK